MIDNKTKQRILSQVHSVRVRETLFIEAALNSAYLAAFQVQDTRISILEKKPKPGSNEFDIGEFFVDVVIDFVIKQWAGKLIASGLERLLRPVIRSRQAYYPLKDQIDGVTPVIALNTNKLRTATASYSAQLNPNFSQKTESEEFKAFKDLPRRILDSSLIVASATARQKIDLPAPKGEERRENRREGRTATVQILASAQETFERQKATLDSQYSALEDIILLEDIDTEKGAVWEKMLVASLSPFTTDELQRHKNLMVMFYEMAIWAHSIDLDMLVTSRPDGSGIAMSEGRVREYLSDPRQYTIVNESPDQITYVAPGFADRPEGGSGGAPIRTIVKIPRDKLDYWINRFPYDLDDPDGPTIAMFYENKWSHSSWREKYGDRMLENGRRILAYDHSLKAFRSIVSDLTRSISALRAARAIG